MNKGLVSKATITINVPIARVWDALVTPATIKQYMFGTDVVSDWKEGSSITWKGEYQGKKYEDKGVILKLEPQRILQYSHFSPLSGQPDVPENYHTVTMELSEQGVTTILSLSQDNNPTEQSREHTAKFWQGMLETLKKLLEE
jgi:uncharacterized protein YndB with AHSA1/START domain